MNDLLQRLYDRGLSTQQVEKILLILDTWLEKEYPFISQMYRVHLLEDLLRKTFRITFTRKMSGTRIDGKVEKAATYALTTGLNSNHFLIL